MALITAHGASCDQMNSLENTRTKHGGEVEGSHPVVLVVALHEGQEVTKVTEEVVVNVRELLDQRSQV